MNYFCKKEVFLLFASFITVLNSCALSDQNPSWSVDIEASSIHSRNKRQVSLNDRMNCGPNDVTPPTREDTQQRVQDLMQAMQDNKIDAYIIPTSDEHQSEYVAEYDYRRQFISGFTGSAGTAVVLASGIRALWTDGRYFLQADDQLDCQWILMKQKVEGVPTILEWLKENKMSVSKVGADPKLISAKEWIKYDASLKESNMSMVSVNENLIDAVWPPSMRPPRSKTPIEPLEMKFAGKKWEDKISEMREIMSKEEADLMVITAMDENAWLYNLRGGDVPHNPVFRSYTLLSQEKIQLFLDKKIGPTVDLHLHVNQCNQECVETHDYKSIVQTLRGLSLSNDVKKVILPDKYSYSGGASFAIYSAVPEQKRHVIPSPVLLTKARKNEIERAGMRRSHIKDAVALIDFLSLMEEEIPAGEYWTEMSAAETLRKFRSEQEYYHSLSFSTISAFGPNGAVIHYRPTNETDAQITDKSIYLLDSGGQYKDGTTDVTRSLHYGTPTEFQIETYTRVLIGALDVASLNFPKGTKDTRVDVLARRSLFEVGLNYNHGTGHGIGMFLNIHEAPIQMRIYGSEEHAFEVGQFFSDEPGYYKAGDFGIRLETILEVVERKTKYESEVPMLGFTPVTLVPFEPKLIDIGLLSKKQCLFLNEYHSHIRKVVGKELKEQEKTRAYSYMMDKSENLNCGMAGSASPNAWSQVSNSEIKDLTSQSTISSQSLSIVLLIIPQFLFVFILNR